MKKLVWGVVMCIILLVSVLGYQYLPIENRDIKEENSTVSMGKNTPKTYEHTFPEQVTKSDYFQWVFLQNDIASVYPRREALVKDILVDIGDEVKEGQTLAILFEPWVSGQAGSNIGFKSTILNSQTKILADTKKVSWAKISEFDATIIEAQTKIQEARAQISEKEMILGATIKNLDSKIAQTANSYDTRVDTLKNNLLFEESALSTLEANLENAKLTKDQKVKEAEDNAAQKKKLLVTKIDEIYTWIVPLLFIGEEGNITYDIIKKSDLSYLLSARDTWSLSQLLSDISSYRVMKDSTDTFAKYDALQIVNNSLIKALENTIVSVDTPESLINSYILRARNYSSILISQREVYEDAESSISTLKKVEDEKISQIASKIEEQKAKIALVESNNTLIITDNSVELTESEKELSVQKLESEIEILKAGVQTLTTRLSTLYKSKWVLIANEDKQITSAANGVATAQADLNKEYIASWDYKIISPFSWVISKRDIEIGSMISPKAEAFRVAWVDNTLSRITKKEVKFYVPESLQDQIALGQEIYFSASDEAKLFSWTVYRISPEIDPETRAITVQAKVDDALSISNKSSLRVTLKTESLSYKIPTASIYNKAERTILYYKKENGKLGVQDINIISDDGEYSLVSWDFDATLKVVTTPIFVK